MSRSRSPDRKEQPERPAHRAEDHAFREQLSYQPQSAGAKRPTHGHLRLACGRARQQQIRHVRAGDQQHEPDGAEQHQDRASNVANDGFMKRHRGEIQTLVGVGILECELLPDGPHFRGDLVNRN